MGNLAEQIRANWEYDSKLDLIAKLAKVAVPDTLQIRKTKEGKEIVSFQVKG